MSHQIKVAKAHKLAPKLPMASKVIWESIPGALIERLTASELALVVNALDQHWHKAVRHAKNEVISEGYLWLSNH